MASKFLMARVLEECNWKCTYCEYCDNDIHPDEDKAIAIFEKYKDRLTHITGGEPGLLSERFWDHVFNTRRVGVLSNGLFIQKGYYEKYHDRLDHLYIHVTPELNNAISPSTLKVIRSKDPIVEPSFVIHKKNIHMVRDFLNKYNDIDFNITISGAQFYPDRGYNITERESALKVIEQLKDFPKYNRIIGRLLKAITSDHWNLCFIPDVKVDKCSECPVKCWIQ